ncbi:MAG TPA: heterodisulfide reductase-related iron-sulfur binding cluster [Candidatus Lokiarchaeia archaeon]|nr:heterodisulfide reductase-related iron-sulfur binding cluster [Candidatus Lokiarchaeia archaeon]
MIDIIENIQVFWGCFIPNRFPHLEKSIRSTLNALKIDFAENNRFTCCPEPSYKNINESAWLLTAGRNLAVAEQLHRDILTPCNGCFETLKTLKIKMREDDKIKKKVNDLLAGLNPPLEFNDSIDVMHLVDYFWKIKEQIQDSVKSSLEDLKIAVHYGCHLIRPSREIQLDNPFEPKILDELVKLVGAKSVPYPDKLLCCGGSYERAGQKEASLNMVQRKLQHMKEAGAQAVLVSCPNCYLQYEMEQAALQKLDVDVNLPVFFITDLIGLALGLSPDDLGMGQHVINPEPVLSTIGQIMHSRSSLPPDFNIDEIERCLACGACKDDCPSCKNGTMDPPALFKKLILGQIDEVLQDPSIWSCLDCYTCAEMCSLGMSWHDTLKKLRNMASEKHYITKGFERQAEAFNKQLRIIPSSKSKRKQLCLPDMPAPDVNDLKEKFQETNE